MTDPNLLGLQWKKSESGEQPIFLKSQSEVATDSRCSHSGSQSLTGNHQMNIPIPESVGISFPNVPERTLPSGSHQHFHQMHLIQDEENERTDLTFKSSAINFLPKDADFRVNQGIVNAITGGFTDGTIDVLHSESTSVPVGDDTKLRKIQQIVDAGIDDRGKQQISQILEAITMLKPPERLLLYLRMPGGSFETDPLRQPQNPLGTRSEINHTINWIRSHLEHDPEVSIPKQEVYEDYLAFCLRVDIKPLSTADFGKVMKQVFPEIRPRRLGTRGNSRYCYAAMRKTTKLLAPQLPELFTGGSIANNEKLDISFDEDAWKIIKIWSEGLLNTRFHNIKELSTHISKNNLNTPASNSSRFLLQKKLIQREAKDKRKSTESGSVKKRRKKRNKSSSSTESFQNPQQPENHTVCVKEEIEEFSFPQPSSSTAVFATNFPMAQHYSQPQMLPMNLVTENDRNIGRYDVGTQLEKKQDKNNINCDVKDNIVLGTQNSSHPLSDEIFSNTLLQEEVKTETPDCVPSTHFCKKVLRAQQSKQNLCPTETVVSIPTTDMSLLVPAQQRTDVSGNYSMGPPAKMDPLVTVLEAKVASRNSQQLRAKKLRYPQSKYHLDDPIQQTDTDASIDKDSLSDNWGLPRERVISICNMDKHELDDYLNGEESQDQEAELLQYFQPDDPGSSVSSVIGQKQAIGSTYDSSADVLHDDSLLNYQANKIGKRPFATHQRDREEITQLRHYLHQNLNKDVEVAGQKAFAIQKLLERVEQNTGCYSNGSSSLTKMSERLRTENAVTSTKMTSNIRDYKRKLNLNSSSDIPKSPNTRTKNCSFVPISPNNSHHTEYGLFASPRSTPLVRKLSLNKQQSLPTSVVDTTSISSASAPPSPSLVQQRFYHTSNTVTSRGNPLLSSTNFKPNMCNDTYSNKQLNNGMQCISQRMAYPSQLSSHESRSQSVPLHYRNSPSFNQYGHFTEYSSACSSMAQTPVPPEFADFSDPSTILEILSDSSQHHSLKPETSNSSLLEIGSSGFVDMLGPELNTKDPNLNSAISRSVPSTPLPHNLRSQRLLTNLINIGSSKAYDISKSVPTTPIGLNVESASFRYSPDYNTDFLINNSTIDSVSTSSYGRDKPESALLSVETNSIPGSIEDLGTFNDVTASIIDSDILNNL